MLMAVWMRVWVQSTVLLALTHSESPWAPSPLGRRARGDAGVDDEGGVSLVADSGEPVNSRRPWMVTGLSIGPGGVTSLRLFGARSNPDERVDLQGLRDQHGASNS